MQELFPRVYEVYLN